MVGRCLCRVGYGLLLCVMGWWATVCTQTSAYAQKTADVSVVVSSLDKTGANNAWIEGVWSESLGVRHRESALYLGGIPEDQSNALSEAAKAFAAGKKAYEELNPETSFRQFTKAIRHYKEASAYTTDIKPLAQALLYIGVGYLLNGQRAQGIASFQQALVFQPTATLAGISTEEDKLQIFKLAEEEIKKLPKHLIKISAETDAAVFIDGRFRGVTPLQVRLSEGEHLIAVRRQGYVSWGRSLRIKGPETLEAQLKALSGQTNWLKLGQSATDNGSQEQAEVPASVLALGQLTGGEMLVIAQTKRVQSRLWIQAAAYDLANKRQVAAGGAWAEWPKGTEVAQELLRSLLRGTPVRLGGWLPNAIGSTGSPPKGGGNAVGIALGITAGVLVLGAGVAIAVYFLTQPRCEKGSCIDLTLK
ncbi:PEGA domain-containing protein [Myxococcota bacterium]|nr:PEGA domain-containing protein [Myxococcota bacterium]